MSVALQVLTELKYIFKEDAGLTSVTGSMPQKITILAKSINQQSGLHLAQP